MAHSSTRKKSNKDDSDSDSEDEVNNDPSFLVAENARLNELLDNRDDVLRKTNKEKREYRSLLREAKEKMVELESLLVDARAQIDSLKSAPIMTDEPECTGACRGMCLRWWKWKPAKNRTLGVELGLNRHLGR
jgi:hypothetical protein